MEWFYSEKVKEHFFNPKNYLKEDEKFEYDGIGKVGNLKCGDEMIFMIKVKDNKIIDCRWRTFGCFEEGELISTPNGFIEIEKIKIGDEIFNHSGKKTFVERTFKRKYKGFIYTIIPLISKFNNLVLTGEHPVLAIKRKILEYSRKQKHTSYIRVDNNILLKTKPDYFPTKSLEQGDYLVYQPPVEIKDIKDIKKIELKLLGFYLSEGYFSGKGKKSEHYNTVAFAFHKNEREYIEELKDLLRVKFKKDPKERIRGNVSETYICSRTAVRFFNKYCSHMAKNKKIHSDLIHLPIKKQEILLNYYFKGDGYTRVDKRKNRQDQFVMSTASKQLALQLQQLIARQGFFATISKQKSTSSKIEGRIIKSGIIYVVIYTKNKKKKSFTKKAQNYFLVPIQKIISKEYNGFVYNFQVYGKNRSYLAKGFAVHNCAVAIAVTSILSEMVKGMKIEDAMNIKPQDIIKELEEIPKIKFHCSVLGDQALRAAIENYKDKLKNS